MAELGFDFDEIAEDFVHRRHGVRIPYGDVVQWEADGLVVRVEREVRRIMTRFIESKHSDYVKGEGNGLQ